MKKSETENLVTLSLEVYKLKKLTAKVISGIFRQPDEALERT
jgi:hypothetical protein